MYLSICLSSPCSCTFNPKRTIQKATARCEGHWCLPGFGCSVFSQSCTACLAQPLALLSSNSLLGVSILLYLGAWRDAALHLAGARRLCSHTLCGSGAQVGAPSGLVARALRELGREDSGARPAWRRPEPQLRTARKSRAMPKHRKGRSESLFPPLGRIGGALAQAFAISSSGGW